MRLSRVNLPVSIVLLSLIACSLHRLAGAARPLGNHLYNNDPQLVHAHAHVPFHAGGSTGHLSPPPPPSPRPPPLLVKKKKSGDDDDGDITAAPRGQARPGAKDCVTHWMTQDLDHFSWDSPSPGGVTTYKQRYLVYDAFWEPEGPIFFYTGNEADVELYADNTGLMWENAETFRALLVFAEHRYYGQSQPFAETETVVETKKKNRWDPAKLRFLTHEQALADYARLIYHLRSDGFAGGAGVASPVVAFGGSYGGMLAAWMRIKYPGSVVGAIAASAPVLAFPGMSPKFDTETYWGVVTRDAAASSSSSNPKTPGCDNLIRRAFAEIFAPSTSIEELASIFRLCTPPPVAAAAATATEDSESMIRSRLAMFLAVAFDTMAMGSYPYPSNYMTGGGDAPKLPAWPIKAACRVMTDAISSTPRDTAEDRSAHSSSSSVEIPNIESLSLLAGLRDAAGVFNNASGSAGACYTLPKSTDDDDEYDGIWDYQWCTELMPQETYFAMDGMRDMFWRREDNATWVGDKCRGKFGPRTGVPRREWIAATTGGGVSGLAQASNIVFSNGAMDPWSSGGVMINLTTSVTAVIIDEGGHHTDLFFTHPDDPPSVVAARHTELELIRGWIENWRNDRNTLLSHNMK